MPLSITAQAWGPTATAITRSCDWVAHASIGQPAGVAPVQAFLPGCVELLGRGQAGALVLTGQSGSEEVQMVASFLGVVGEDHAWGGNNSVEQGSAGKRHARPTHTSQPQLHSHALVLQAIYDLTAVATRIIDLQPIDNQRQVAWHRAAQVHTAAEATVAAVAVAYGNHHLRLSGSISRGVGR